jgi:hypothetical protein
MHPSNFATERKEQHPKWIKTHLKVPEQKLPRQFFFRGAIALVGLGLLIVEDS